MGVTPHFDPYEPVEDELKRLISEALEVCFAARRGDTTRYQALTDIEAILSTALGQATST